MNYLVIDGKTIYEPLINIVKDIKRSLTNGKLKVIKLLGNNIRVSCPHHKDGLEINPDSDIYIGPKNDKVEYGWFKCFACGEQGPFYHFVAECFDISDSEAKEWLLDNYWDGIIQYSLDLDEIDLGKKKSEFLNESILKTFEDFHPYMIQRKLSKEVIEKFQIKYNPKTQCIVFPVRDEKGNLTMLTQRSVNSKKFIIDKDKIKPVYLLNYLIDNNITQAFICESQINALTCHSYHIPAVALFGTGTKEQYNILNKSPIRHYILCFDGDEAGNKGIREFFKNIRKDVLIDVINIPRNKDINDLSKEEFLKLIDLKGISSKKVIKNYEEKTLKI